MTRACTCTHLEFRHKRGKGGHGSKRGECLECVTCEKFEPQQETEDTDMMCSLADAALKEMREEITKMDELTPYLAMHHHGTLQRIPLPEGGLDMNDGDTKDVIFGMMRQVAQSPEVTAVVIGTDMWQGVPTPKLLRLSHEEIKRISANNNTHQLERLGYCTKRACIGAIVQTPRRVLHVFQYYKMRRGKFDGFEETARYESGQDTYMGRTKMFGEEVPEYFKDVIEAE